MHNCLSEFNLEKTSIKNKLFLEHLLKGFKPKSRYTKKGKNNIEKASDNLFLGNKKLMMSFIKM